MKTINIRIFLLIAVMNYVGLSQTGTQDTLIFINPKSSYLRLNNDSGALDAIPIKLSDIGLYDRDYIILQQQGDYNNGPGGDVYTGMTGVFSFTDSLLESSLQYRIPDAIEAGEDFITHNTWYGDFVTDIPEDFYIDSIVIQIPDSGKYLFISPHDSWFNDNSDPDSDYSVRILKTELNNLESFIPSSTPVFKLFDNYPNPFNPSTKIKFTIPKAQTVRLQVYNTLGQIVGNLIEGKKLQAGTHAVEFNAGHLASGVYYFQLATGNYREVKKMILLR
jgi:hypothetical protein